MKQLLLLLAVVISLDLAAQSSSKDSTIEQFCILTAFHRPNSSIKVSIDLDYGQERKSWLLAENALKDEETGILRKFNSIADGLNYLGRQGWKLVAVAGRDTSGNDYIFKKEFRVTASQ